MLYEVPPRYNHEQNYGAYWEGFLTEEDINLILAQPEWLDLSLGEVADEKLNSELQVRRSKINWLNKKPELDDVWEKIVGAVADVNSRFFHFDLRGLYEPAQLTVYSGQTQDTYEWHVDCVPNTSIKRPPRKLSLSLLLSDPADYEGGDLMIKSISDEPMVLEQRRGRAW